MTPISRRWIVLLVIVGLVLGALGVGLWMTRGAGGRERIVDLFEVFPAEDRLELKPAEFRTSPAGGTTRSRRRCPPCCAPAPGSPRSPTASRWAARGPAGSPPARPRTGGRPAPRRPASPPGDRAAVRRFFESRFRPWSVRNHRNPVGLFTGYYEPLLHGSRKRHGALHRAALRPPAGAGDGRPRPLPRRPQGEADRRQGGGRRARALPGPQGDRRRRPRRPQAGDRLGGRPGRGLLPPGPGLRPRPARGGGRDADRLRGAERPRLLVDRQGPDPARRPARRHGLDADHPRLAQGPPRPDRRACWRRTPRTSSSRRPRRGEARARWAPKGCRSPPAARWRSISATCPSASPSGSPAACPRRARAIPTGGSTAS